MTVVGIRSSMPSVMALFADERGRLVIADMALAVKVRPTDDVTKQTSEVRAAGVSAGSEGFVGPVTGRTVGVGRQKPVLP